MRLTDFCHLNQTACTRTSRVPGSLRGFHRVDTPQSLGLCAFKGSLITFRVRSYYALWRSFPKLFHYVLVF
jgi:hypothetical protein